MPLIIADRVKETTTTTGTGTVTLLGASTGFQSFAAVGNANTTYYTIAGQTGSEWEVGIGTYTVSGTTLARNTVLSSSNSGSLVNFSAGAKDVFVTYPAGTAVAVSNNPGTAAQVLTSNGADVAPTFQTPAGGGGATLNGVTAATANQAGIANADFNIRWNWAKTTNTTVALELGETTAATGGTSTAGVPNQVGLKLSTLTASTMSPLSVFSRGNHVFSVSPTTTQILAANGAFGNPAYSFAGSLGSGIYAPTSGNVNIVGNTINLLTVVGTSTAVFKVGQIGAPDGGVSTPGLGFFNEDNTGFFRPSAGAVVLTLSGAEAVRFTPDLFQASRGISSAAGYAINSRKARGTVVSPTVITTGDDLLTVSGLGYVGATNTYREAARITYDSTGAISDSTSGIGGIIRFSTANQGVAGVTERFAVTNTGEFTIAGAAGTAGQVFTSGGAGAAPTWSAAGGGGGGVATGFEQTFLLMGA